jgi:anti-sigma regulatory factor (Ser/Thr protein kinase)
VSDFQWRHDQTWSGEPPDVHDARQFVAGHLERHGLEVLVDDAVLVVSELVTNVVLHARTPFAVSLFRTDGHVFLRVGDASAAQPRTVSGDVLDTSGRGLSIVEAVSQAWGVDNSRDREKYLWASFPVPREGGPDDRN